MDIANMGWTKLSNLYRMQTVQSKSSVPSLMVSFKFPIKTIHTNLDILIVILVAQII